MTKIESVFATLHKYFAKYIMKLQWTKSSLMEGDHALSVDVNCGKCGCEEFWRYENWVIWFEVRFSINELWLIPSLLYLRKLYLSSKCCLL